MTLKQFELLEYLIQNNGKILTREQIFDRIWGFDSDTTIAIVEVFIHQLRKNWNLSIIIKIFKPFGVLVIC